MENILPLSFQLKKKAISLIFNLLFFDSDKEPEFKLIGNKQLAPISDNFKKYLFENETIDTYNHFASQYSKKLNIKQKSYIHSLYLYICNTNFDKNVYLKSIDDLTVSEKVSLQIADSFLNNRIENPLVKGFIADLIIVKGGIEIYHENYISKDFYQKVIIQQIKKYNENVEIHRKIR